MRDDAKQLDDLETQQLVAYLDKELDEPDSLEIEQRLAADPEFRERLQQLQRTWDLLDYLPRAATDDDFTKSTIEMVTVSVGGKVQRSPARTMRIASLWGAAAVIALVAAGTGYRATSRIVSAPDRQLVRDLPLIENVDLYSHVDDIEFLRALDQSGLFADDEIIEDLNGAT